MSVYIVVWVSGPTVSLPLTPFAPLQPPEAVQAVALEEFHVSTLCPPELIVAGLALNDKVGADADVTVIVALPTGLVPPAPVHCRLYVAVAVRLVRFSEPDVAREPLHAPEAVQLVAFVEDQVSCELPPLATVVGFALIVAVGAGGGGAPLTVTVTFCIGLLPPVPEHCSENIVVLVRLLIV